MRGAGCFLFLLPLAWAAAPVNLNLVGDAALQGEVIRLTPAKHDRSGAAWLREKQPVGSGFDTSFEFQLTKPGGLGHGADGFAFVIQNAGPEALGGRGSAGGFAVTDPNYQDREDAIPWSVAVFFDTFRNEYAGDPSANYIAVCTYGKPAESQWPAPRLGFTRDLPVKLKDRRVHTARILFQPPVLTVYLDGAEVLESTVDLSVVVDDSREAWVGFTASTGGGYENHDIRNWSFSRADISSTMVSSHLTFLPSACLPDRNLCTPERAAVRDTEAGQHVVLPGNVAWSASIPNPLGREMEIRNAQGIVCWDFKAQRSSGCTGPVGRDTAAGPGFLSPDAPAGALIRKNAEGRTWFSVNGRAEGGFEANEGFYEFDVELR